MRDEGDWGVSRWRESEKGEGLRGRIGIFVFNPCKSLLWSIATLCLNRKSWFRSGGYTATYTEAAGQPVCLLINNPTAENEKCPSCLP